MVSLAWPGCAYGIGARGRRSLRLALATVVVEIAKSRLDPDDVKDAQDSDAGHSGRLSTEEAEAIMGESAQRAVRATGIQQGQTAPASESDTPDCRS